MNLAKIQNETEKGFTLIELLVVIAIIGILVAMSFLGLNGVFENSRDTQRKSDLKQYQNALENFANSHNGYYPSELGSVRAADTLCDKMGLSNCPEDPIYDELTGIPYYSYVSNGTGDPNINATTYVLWATMEAGDYSYFQVCSNGTSGATDELPDGVNCSVH